MKRNFLLSLILIFIIGFLFLFYYYFYSVSGKVSYLTIIDDDTRIETYTYWSKLSKETGVNITIAAVPNWINGNGPDGIKTMSLEQLKEMYNNGNDVVSHGFDTLTIQDNISNGDITKKQLLESKKWLIDNGFTRSNGYDYFVWPQGLSGSEDVKEKVKLEASKYYSFAVNAFTDDRYLKKGLFDAYDIPRATSDGQRSLRLIHWMRQAINDGGWMIVLSHSWHAKDYDDDNYDKWSSRYRYLIWYAKINNVQIVTLPEGMKLWCMENALNDQCKWLNAQSKNL